MSIPADRLAYCDVHYFENVVLDVVLLHAAAATFAVVGFLVGRGRSRTVRNVIAGVVVGLAVLVAASRVMLGVHWLTDVIAGIAVGWAWLAVCSFAFGGRLVQFGAPVAAATTVADRGRDTISNTAPRTRR